MRYLLLFAVILSGTVQAAEVYRWVDRDGVVHYSDQWQPGAEKIRLQESPTYRGQPSPEGIGPESSQPATAEATSYRALAILSPAQEEVLWNIGGKLRVALRLTPSLQEGDRLRLFIDGAMQDMAPGQTTVDLTDIYRGVHTLTAEVVGPTGAVRIKSETTTFVVRQTSLAQPGAATPRPRP